MGPTAFKPHYSTYGLLSSSCNQGAEDSIECYRQKMKMIRQKTVTAVDKEPTHEANAVASAQILEAKLQSKLAADTESVSTNEPQSDDEVMPTMNSTESDDAVNSSDEQGDPTEKKALINHKSFNGGMQWPAPLAALPGAHFVMRPRVGPRGGLIVQPQRPSLPPPGTDKLADLIASNSLYS